MDNRGVHLKLLFQTSCGKSNGSECDLPAGGWMTILSSFTAALLRFQVLTSGVHLDLISRQVLPALVTLASDSQM